MDRGLLIVAHGSRANEAKNVVIEIVNKIQSLNKYKSVKAGFMEFDFPDIPLSIKQFVEEGIFDIIVAPLFLFEGMHIKVDIPSILKKEAEKYPGISIKFARPIGYDDRIIDILLSRIEEII
ncbi:MULTISPECIES: sirohydrochlorin chelatase [Thermoanaerobacterium]|uniref:Cobalamin (Vitamin B12) biosynthesis CbiX protein n=2 Tax=Thermoanaerobacterium TaxID=28895 RepID=W9E7S0_9THEO|nr:MULTISPECIES: CbiX/SirB N-terminal domain-containing protein [Thermoanaerobacterium]AFK87642.1 cobalamin (vitamin B12) biosynthesis CbiX protein [Thermoanaerobacterium saccharolyticum JW/SL-YS485]ETO37577.1 cobalamin (vitamin B12) biosynthesis CbiX protein [Thermoanaerobacterium aotearoense SCUT27]